MRLRQESCAFGKSGVGRKTVTGTEHHPAPTSLSLNTVLKTNMSAFSLRWGSQWSPGELGMERSFLSF